MRNSHYVANDIRRIHTQSATLLREIKISCLKQHYDYDVHKHGAVRHLMTFSILTLRSAGDTRMSIEDRLSVNATEK
jgi:hypothetical protein